MDEAGSVAYEKISQLAVIRVTAHRDRTGNNLIGPVASGDVIPAGIDLKFEALTSIGVPYTSREHDVKWQVTNTDRQAWLRDALRGDFYSSKPRGVRWRTPRVQRHPLGPSICHQ